MPADILKKCFVQFKQLRSVELSNAALMTDFSLWKTLGTLPSLKNFTVEVDDPESHPAHAPENSNGQSGGLRYFDALESLHFTGPFFVIPHLIDSPCLESIEVSPCHHDSEREHEPGDLLTPSMMIVASKWSRPLKELKIGKYQIGITHRNSKFLMPLVDLHELRKLDLVGWRMEKNNDALRRLSWTLNGISILSHLSMMPLAKSLCHKLDFLVLRGVHQTNPSISPECHIQIARHLDLIFSYVGSISVRDRDWSGFMTWSSFARTPDEVSRMQGK